MKNKREVLLFSMGKIDDALVENAAPGHQTEQRKEKRWLRWSVAAACLCLALGAGALSGLFGTGDWPVAHQPNPGQRPGQPGSVYVDVADLLAPEDGAVSTEALNTLVIPVDGRMAEYRQAEVSAQGAGLLPDSLGEPLEGVDNWYRLAGHDELQYLIREEGGVYTLWKFYAFQPQDGQTSCSGGLEESYSQT